LLNIFQLITLAIVISLADVPHLEILSYNAMACVNLEKPTKGMARCDLRITSSFWAFLNILAWYNCRFERIYFGHASTPWNSRPDSLTWISKLSCIELIGGIARLVNLKFIPINFFLGLLSHKIKNKMAKLSVFISYL